MHTNESRGSRVKIHSNIQPKTAIDVLKKRNIQVAAITDHDNMRAYPKIKDYAEKNGIMLINGIEITTRDGEIIGLNVKPGIERELNKKMSVHEARDAILDYNGEILIPHPFDVIGNGIGKKIRDIKGIVEVFNPGNLFGFEDKFARIVAEKLKLPMIASSDAHYTKMIDRGITVVDSEPNIDSIFKSIKKGKVRFENCRYVTWKEIKEWALIRVSSSYSDMINNLKDGWETDRTYMKFANLKFMRFIEKKTIELGFSRPDSKIWDAISHMIFLIYSLYAWRAKRRYENFVFSI
jgi:predicted metal-dependent phosphoesterase TrpH